ncbi:uncharacterized protein DS421_15g490740 [Arachis hypogaea]|nr:uncharacterized protein DS421_15g490740 [Arachis hypogaea]
MLLKDKKTMNEMPLLLLLIIIIFYFSFFLKHTLFLLFLISFVHLYQIKDHYSEPLVLSSHLLLFSFYNFYYVYCLIVDWLGTWDYSLFCFFRKKEMENKPS